MTHIVGVIGTINNNKGTIRIVAEIKITTVKIFGERDGTVIMTDILKKLGYVGQIANGEEDFINLSF